MMTLETLRARLSEGRLFDWMFNSSITTDNGMKISIQGKGIDDCVFLFGRLSEYLYSNDVPFKVATLKRFELININKEQSHKAMTIYCPDGSNFLQLCEDIYGLILDYKGWQNIKTPSSYQHYAGGLFIRNDRDVNGVYIPANKV